MYPDNFSIQYKRNTSNYRIDREIEVNIIQELKIEKSKNINMIPTSPVGRWSSPDNTDTLVKIPFWRKRTKPVTFLIKTSGKIPQKEIPIIRIILTMTQSKMSISVLRGNDSAYPRYAGRITVTGNFRPKSIKGQIALAVPKSHSVPDRNTGLSP